MKLNELLNSLKAVQVAGNAEAKEIDSITIDSREVKRGSLFIAIKGEKTDGHNFIQDCINNGASAVILDDDTKVPEQLFAHSGCVKILVEDSRKALPLAANIFFRNPSADLMLTGITGTKGKTTTAFYVKNIFEFAGMKSGLIGTIANYIGSREVKTMLTTPQSHTINQLLRDMVNAGCKTCAMEVSSHALALNRADYLTFASAIFTNITSDHMDYHKTFEHYFNSKKILFTKLCPGANAIYNIDDLNAVKMVAGTKAKTVSYGTADNADFRISNIEYNLDGTTFEVYYNSRNFCLSTSLIGRFNAYNATAAFANAVLLGVDADTAVEGIKNAPQVPGRFEVVTYKNRKVIVDYSHTADSLSQALTAVRHIVKGERPVVTVFGCGGDRDKTKRPVMGSIAASMSDFAYVTSDNPRTENPELIIDDIIAGIKTDNYKRIANREEAIRAAVFESKPESIILIAGKGHENYQEINGVRTHFSDKELAEKYLKECQN
jgi:UDP-N-acetylmuramoyl-L-alanyl-D-glutamate--2,6-diaminopimelate ligase